MGTYGDSKIRRAMRVYDCACGCGAQVRKGDRYLDFKIGMKRRQVIALPCATAKRDDGIPKYDVAVTRAEVGAPADRTGRR